MRLNCRVKLKIKGIVWMYVIGEQEEEQIGLVERLEMTDGRVQPVAIRRSKPRIMPWETPWVEASGAAQ